MIQHRDGIHLRLPSGQTIVADARRAVGDVNIVSHAHADHLLRSTDATVLCSKTTAAVARHRLDLDELASSETHDRITLIPSGHILGSRAALIEEDDTRYLYTGDVSTRDRVFLDGFEAVPADILIIETTYGRPKYRFPAQEIVERRLLEWIEDAGDVPLVFFGYALGRAQILQYLLKQVPDRRTLVDNTIAAVNDVIEAETNLSLDATRYDGGRLNADDVLVLPGRASNNGLVDTVCERDGAKTAGFSGWALDGSFGFNNGFDETFVLSDHCDFTELVEIVKAVNPDKVYTHHGFDEAFADHVSTELGIEAWPLKRHQTTITDFG